MYATPSAISCWNLERQAGTFRCINLGRSGQELLTRSVTCLQRAVAPPSSAEAFLSRNLYTSVRSTVWVKYMTVRCPDTTNPFSTGYSSHLLLCVVKNHKTLHVIKAHKRKQANKWKRRFERLSIVHVRMQCCNAVSNMNVSIHTF